MVAGQISATDTQEITPPTSSSETPLDRDSWVIQINAQQQILLNDNPIVLADLVVGDKPLEQVVIKADQNTTAKTLHPVLMCHHLNKSKEIETSPPYKLASSCT